VEDFMLLADGNDLNPKMIQRWSVFLKRTARQHHPVFAPWHAYAALPDNAFADQAPGVLAQLTATSDPARPLHPLVVQALTQRPPQTMSDVARTYGDLLKSVEHLWQETLAIADVQGQPAPTTLSDPAQEELRQVLYGPTAPPQVPLTPYGDLDLLADRPSQAKHQELRRALEQWRSKAPGAPPRAMTLEDLPAPIEPYVFVRGNPSNRGETVPRRFLGFLGELAGQPSRPFVHGSGRLELAQAIVAPDNPLTARVLVNRVWQQHFGQGLVATPSDFGLRSEPPTHPELLDYLAATFVENGWSIKQLHREIMRSAVYRQASADRPEGKRLDPENTLLWKMNRRRLDWEATRDSLLAVAERLNRTVGGPPVRDTFAPTTTRRTLYGFLDRQALPGLYRTFDFPSPDATSPQRDSTTVAPQALFLMNHPLVAAAARGVAQRRDLAQETDAALRVQRLYRVLFGRAPSARELTLAQGYAAESGSWERLAQALLMTNEFVFID